MQVFALRPLTEGQQEAVAYVFKVGDRVYVHWLNDGAPERSLIAFTIFQRKCILNGRELKPIDMAEVPVGVQQQLRSAVTGDQECLTGVAEQLGMVLMPVGA